MENAQKYARDDPRCQFPGKISVMFAGFPKNTDMQQAQTFFDSICYNNDYTIVKKKKKLFRGYGFIHVNTDVEADKYATSVYTLDGSKINVKIIKSRDDHIKESIFMLIEPKKVFMKQIPLTVTKEHLRTTFSKFGNVEHIWINKQPDESFFNSFIEYESYIVAKKCIEVEKVQINDDIIVKVKWARPN